jgi:stage III sporulation protein SpoIIIAA
VGRAIYGTVDIIRDFVESGKSILLMGKPGVGKTTLLREAARVLADDLEKRVIVVDTSNEIAGDGDVPHPGIGRARRMQVPEPEHQHGVMIEAVENHMPEVIVIDEIGTAHALGSCGRNTTGDVVGRRSAAPRHSKDRA